MVTDAAKPEKLLQICRPIETVARENLGKSSKQPMCFPFNPNPQSVADSDGSRSIKAMAAYSSVECCNMYSRMVDVATSSNASGPNAEALQILFFLFFMAFDSSFFVLISWSEMQSEVEHITDIMKNIAVISLLPNRK